MASLKLNDIFFKTIIDYNLNINPIFLNKDLDINLNKILKNKIEGKCINEGYVLKDSVNIMDRSIGLLNNNQFDGHITFKLKVGLKVCNIPNETVIECIVKKKNKLGILAELGPLLIIVPIELHKNKSYFKEININDKINVFVVGKTFKLNSKNISIYGKLNSEVNKKIKISKNSNEIENDTFNKIIIDSNEEIIDDENDDDIEISDDDNTIDIDEEIEISDNENNDLSDFEDLQNDDDDDDIEDLEDNDEEIELSDDDDLEENEY